MSQVHEQSPSQASQRRRGVCRHGASWLCVAAISVACLGSTSAAAADPDPVKWRDDWPRFRPWEAVATGLLAAQAVTATLLYPDPGRNWRGGILFDDSVRDALLLGSYDARENARPVSDNIYRLLGVYPLLVDNLVVTWAVHGSGDVALEMLGMNLEGYALTGALVLTAQKLGRERPAARGCATDPMYSPKCRSEVGLAESFFSGHTAIDATAAGLICAHHQHLPLYGGGWPDIAVCGVAAAAALTQGALRIMTDDHYASDVLVGLGVGTFSGYVLPNLLHYGFGKVAEKKAGTWLPIFTAGPRDAPLVAVLAPDFDAHYAGLNLVGAY
jgi:membrane-associated phospholipid phosphatase